MNRRLWWTLGLGVVAIAAVVSLDSARETPPEPPPPPTDPAEAYAADVAALQQAAVDSRWAFDTLKELCEDIGPRLSGTPELTRAIAWSQDKMKEAGLTRIRAEAVDVPRWVRGEESLQMVEPYPMDWPMLGLGRSMGTPPEGIEAEVVPVGSFAELAALGDAVAGKMVLWDVPFTTYGETVGYRYNGHLRAAEQGAVASLVRSVTPSGDTVPHTGSQAPYPDDPSLPRVPGAAVSIEAAQTMHRLHDRGQPVRVRLSMQAQTLDDAPSANVVGDLVGRDRPDEIVLVGCHLDSWDVGQGAQDDGAGCAAILDAVRLLAQRPEPPRRTVRVVFYTNEENGLRGAKGYVAAHPDAAETHVAAIEMDTGAGRPTGFRVDVRDPETGERDDAASNAAIAALQPIRPLLESVGAG